MKISAYVSWPSAPLTDSLVRKALEISDFEVEFLSKDKLKDAEKLLQWSTYDDLDHELTAFNHTGILSSNYTFRKALIRKHFLSRIIQGYLKKQPNSVLSDAVPRTYEIEISFADELDEMWTDELWDLGQELNEQGKWWILKPGMADRGMGIRLFHTKDEIRGIFESFEADSDEEDAETLSTDIVASQLRHFVIQEYISKPLLLDPCETMNVESTRSHLVPHKFHLRAYCVASGALRLYLYTRVLALFSSAPYVSPSDTPLLETGQVDLRPHLTNTSLQTESGEINVRLLDELVGCTILSSPESKSRKLVSDDVESLIKQMGEVLAETFKAALQNPVHFQALPNAFELFGVDFVIEHDPLNASRQFQVKLLEINSEPAIELTGPRLTWILEDMFVAIPKICIEPFFGLDGQANVQDNGSSTGWELGKMRENFLKCHEVHVRLPET